MTGGVGGVRARVCVCVCEGIRVSVYKTHTGLHLRCHVGDQRLRSGSHPPFLTGFGGTVRSEGQNGGKQDFIVAFRLNICVVCVRCGSEKPHRFKALVRRKPLRDRKSQHRVMCCLPVYEHGPESQVAHFCLPSFCSVASDAFMTGWSGMEREPSGENCADLR